MSPRLTALNSYWEGSTSYSYDHTSQLTGADHSSSGPADESYSYDENGNRTMSGYDTDSNNRLASDGTYNYTYDAEGNRLTRTSIASGYVTEYAWDYRNRLISVTEKDDSDNVLSTAAYTYDVNNRRIEKSVDSDGPGSTAAVDTFFSWEHDQIALQLDGSGAVSHRYLYGPVVDQVLADETVTSTSSPGDVLWPLADHLGTVADLATHNSSTHATVVANHRTFDSYGNITAETNSAVDTIFAFTGAQRDAESGLQYQRARYYDPAIGRFISEDPTEFKAGDSDLLRYSNNDPTNAVDPTGLFTIGGGFGLQGQLICLHVGVSIDLTIGINTNANSIGDIFSGGLGITPSGSLPFNLGLGGSGDAHISISNANYAGDLGGGGGAVGAYGGPFGGDFFFGGSNGNGAPAYGGVTFGVGPGAGGGAYIDGTETVQISVGNTSDGKSGVQIRK